MTPLHHGLLVSSPYETNEPPAGSWTFTIRAEDTSGNLSTSAWIIAELPNPRLGETFLWACPTARGWPGTLTDTVRSDDGRDALEGAGNYTWDDLNSWADWSSWSLGDGDDGVSLMRYESEPVDLGTELPFSIAWSAETDNDVTFEIRTADSAEALAQASWESYLDNTLLTAQHLQLRWSLAGDGSTQLSLDNLCYQILGTASTEKFLDVDTSDWEGSAETGRTIPTSLARVTDLDITLQSVGPGWSWYLQQKNNPTMIRIYDRDGTAQDAVVDAVLRGIQA